MSVQCEITAKSAAGVPMSFFERYLTIWVFLCIVTGIVFGQFAPNLFQAIGRMEVAQVNLPVGLLIWVMIIPMLVKVDFGAMAEMKQHVTNGHPLFTLSQVALNDTIMVFAFAPLVAFLLGISAITVPWDTLLTSVVLYIVIPVVIAQLWRKALLAKGQGAFDAAMEKIGPWSITALLATLVLLFAFQGEAILRQPLIIGLLAVPILIQVFFNSALAYWLNRKVGEKHNVACPSALIGASNFFELAVAAAISLFGFESGAALATVVGVLIEVPAMLLVVKVVNASKEWYEAG